jgi:hypothetical protein
MLETKKKYCLTNRTNRSNPNRVGLVLFGFRFYYKSQPNQIKLHTFLSYGLDDF